MPEIPRRFAEGTWKCGVGAPAVHFGAGSPETAAQISRETASVLHAHWKFTKRPVVRSRSGRRRPELHPTRQVLRVVLLSPTREATNAAIDDRFRLMIEAGALDEIALLDGIDGDLPALKAVGVPDLRRHLRGGIDLETAVARAQTATRQFAKRQTTWLKIRSLRTS